MADVGEECAFRLQSLHGLQRMFNGRMRGMRLETQGIQKKNVEPLQLRQRCFGNIAMIGQICRGSEAKSINLGITVNDGDWFK